jgi:hypothetical protein
MAESPHEAKYAVADQRMFWVKRCWGAVMVVPYCTVGLSGRYAVTGDPPHSRGFMQRAPRPVPLLFPPGSVRGMLRGTRS